MSTNKTINIPSLNWVNGDQWIIARGFLPTIVYVMCLDNTSNIYRMYTEYLDENNGVKQKHFKFKTIEAAKKFAEDDYLNNLYKFFGADRTMCELKFLTEIKKDV